MADAKPEAAPTSGGASKVAIQLTKLRDANVKYKTLLKKAKERIEQQEEELTKLKGKFNFIKLIFYQERVSNPSIHRGS